MEFLLEKQWIYIGIPVLFMAGAFMHYFYSLSRKNVLVGLIAPVNESVWEHIKIAVIPTYIVALVKMWIIEERKCNLWSSLFFKVITIIILIPTFFYSYQAITKIESVVIDIIIFYISIICSELIEYFVQNRFKISSKNEDVFKYLNLFMIITFIVFTFIPPRFEIFKDKITNKYGI